MHNHFANSCHFEGAREQEHERHSAGHSEGHSGMPSFCPSQAEHQEFFRQSSHATCNRNSYPMPEVSINIGSERHCEPEYFAGMQHSAPRFCGRDQQWDNNDNNYNYGNHYRISNFNDRGGYSLNLNLNFDQGGNYSGNQNFDDRYNYIPSRNFDDCYSYGPNQNTYSGYNDSGSNNFGEPATYAGGNDYSGYPGQSVRPGADISNDLIESSYSDPGYTSPHNINYGDAYDHPAYTTAAGDQSLNQAAPAAASSDDITAQINWLVDHVPLGTADSADYIIIPAGATNSTDQVSVPPLPVQGADTNATDQVTIPPSVDHTNSPPSPAASDSAQTTGDQTAVPNVYGAPT